MKVSVLFFASFKETLDCSSLELELDEQSNVAMLCNQLAEKGEAWQQVFQTPETHLKVSINQEMAELQQVLIDGDEIAFFPPVTGG